MVEYWKSRNLSGVKSQNGNQTFPICFVNLLSQQLLHMALLNLSLMTQGHIFNLPLKSADQYILLDILPNDDIQKWSYFV